MRYKLTLWQTCAQITETQIYRDPLMPELTPPFSPVLMADKAGELGGCVGFPCYFFDLHWLLLFFLLTFSTISYALKFI